MKWRTGDIPEGENILFQLDWPQGSVETRIGRCENSEVDPFDGGAFGFDPKYLDRWIPLSEVLEAIECPSKT